MVVSTFGFEKNVFRGDTEFGLGFGVVSVSTVARLCELEAGRIGLTEADSSFCDLKKWELGVVDFEVRALT